MAYSFSFRRLFSSGYDILEITYELLKLNKVKVTKGNLETTLMSHPDFSSLLSVGDTLDRLGVENIAARVDFEKIKSLEIPYLILIKEDNDEKPYFSLVIRRSVEYVIVRTPKKAGARKIFWDQLEKGYQNVVFLTIPDVNVIEDNYKQNYMREIVGRILTLIIPFFILFFLIQSIQRESQILLTLIHSLLSFTGLCISYFLVTHEVGGNNRVIQTFCGVGKPKQNLQLHTNNCETILNSKAASIFGLKLGEISFAYFSISLLLSLVYLWGAEQLLPYLIALSCLGAVFIPFSIYYQSIVARKWCRVCLFVQLILFIQLGIVLITAYQIPLSTAVVSVQEFVLFVTIGGLIPLYTITSISELLKRNNSFVGKLREISSFKYNKNVFTAILQGQQKMQSTEKEVGVLLGKEGENKINLVMACNPNYGPCGTIFSVLNKLLETRNISLRIIFTAQNQIDDPSLKPVQIFMNEASENSEERLKELLLSWFVFPEKRKDILSDYYPKITDFAKIGSEMESMYICCKQSNIAFTPTFYINGFMLPEFYSIKEALLVIDK